MYQISLPCCTQTLEGQDFTLEQMQAGRGGVHRGRLPAVGGTIGTVTEHGIIPYDLDSGYFCEECGRAKSLRLFDNLTGCATCDDVITTHRCTGRPSLDDLALGESWECRECGTAWSAVEEEDFCSECGRSGPSEDMGPRSR